MSNVKISLGVLQRISEFLADLPEEHLEDLAHGRARLAYVPVGATEPVAATRSARPGSRASSQPFIPSQATTDVLHRFETLQSRAEAAVLLAPLKKPALVDIARTLSVPAVSKLSMADLRAEIVESTVGRRLDSIAIRGFDGLRP